MKKKRLFLIDGNSFCYRAFYAIKGLATSRGQPTNAVYGFATMLRKIVGEEKPEYLAVSFDLPKPTFRHRKFEEYKIHRKPMPEGLTSQMPVIKELVKAHRIPIFELEGFEADDILATVAKKMSRRSFDVYIVTGDKDALQLVDSKVKVYSPHKEGFTYDVKGVQKRFGVGPERIVDIMALAGDPTDNIPGVPGIGEKTAIELIKKYSSLDGVMANLEKIEGESRKRAIQEHIKEVELSRELARIRTDVPIEFDLQSLKAQEPDKEKLFELYKELEFKSLLKEVAPEEAVSGKFRMIKAKKDLQELRSKLKKAKNFSYRLKIEDTKPIHAESKAISISANPVRSPEGTSNGAKGGAFYIPLADAERGPGREEVIEALREIFEDENIKKFGHDVKLDRIVFASSGVHLRGIAFDTKVASYLLNPERSNHELEDISLEYLGVSVPKGKLDSEESTHEANLLCAESDLILRLKSILEAKLRDKSLYELFIDIELPLIDVLATMEKDGVSIDTEFLSKMGGDLQKKLEGFTRDIYKMAGCEFNINSPKQLSQVLFEKLKLPVIKRTKTGFSTDVEVLNELAKLHPLPATLLKFRELSKLKSTYVDALPELIDSNTGRVHTSFNQTVTATGRLSSSEPNLQNIPIKAEEGRKIRKAFVPSEDRAFIMSADYSQIELRILAHFSKDEELLKAFTEDVDVHSHTASLIFGVNLNGVTPEMRNAAKTVNFGIVYGMSPYGLAKELGIEPGEAQRFIDSYFKRYSKVKKFLEKTIEDARKKGYVTTLLKRRRYIPDINSENTLTRQFAERTAINAPIQGSAADLIKVAMINIHRAFEEEGLSMKMILQVHDELVFEVPEEELSRVARLVREKMEASAKLVVPIKVKVAAGKNWLEMEEVKK